jgi:4-diphosphocytidyl-2-C-methyl-D-erythritol kinase
VSYSIRPARPGDLDALPAIEYRARELFEDCIEATGLTREFLERVSTVEDFSDAQADGTLWVAESDAGELVGFAIVVFVGGLPHLDELDVLPEHGRRGIGSRLLDAVCQWAADAGYGAVTLSTFRYVPWNLPFYARRGFRVVPPADLSDEYVALVENEEARGLRTDLRVVMIRDCGGPAERE